VKIELEIIIKIGSQLRKRIQKKWNLVLGIAVGENGIQETKPEKKWDVV